MQDTIRTSEHCKKNIELDSAEDQRHTQCMPLAAGARTEKQAAHGVRQGGHRPRNGGFAKPPYGGEPNVIPFEDLVNIMEFALDHTILRDFDGQLWRQARGIPMGEPHSPGMTIGTCAWMEHEWLQTVHADSRENFLARRYMDDLLAFYAQRPDWDEERFLGDIREHCYLPPLRLEAVT